MNKKVEYLLTVIEHKGDCGRHLLRCENCPVVDDCGKEQIDFPHRDVFNMRLKLVKDKVREML